MKRSHSQTSSISILCYYATLPMWRSQFDSDMLLMEKDLKNHFKKLIYKIQPPAKLIYVTKDRLLYRTDVEEGEVTNIITFSIPLGDIGDAKFYDIMDAKLLLRWLE